MRTDGQKDGWKEGQGWKVKDGRGGRKKWKEEVEGRMNG